MIENGEKTEPASPKKLEKGKKRGLYPRSEELFRSLLWGVALFFLYFWGPRVVEGLKNTYIGAKTTIFPILGFCILVFLLSFSQRGKKKRGSLSFLLLKIGFFCGATPLSLWFIYKKGVGALDLPLELAFSLLFSSLFKVGFFLWIGYGLIAVLDMGLQRRRYAFEMRMTKEEKKEEEREENTQSKVLL